MLTSTKFSPGWYYKLWYECAQCSTHMDNLVVRKGENKNSQELFFGSIFLNPSRLIPFGTPGVMNIEKHGPRSNLQKIG